MLLQERLQIRDTLFKILYKYNYIELYHIDQYRFKNKSTIRSFLKMINSELLEKYDQYLQEFNSQDEALYCITHKDDYTNHLCPVCKNICKYVIGGSKYRKTCASSICMETLANSPEAKAKGEQTCLKKYDTKNPMQNLDIISKLKQTCLRLYNVTNVSKLKSIRQKAEDTMQQRYDVKNFNEQNISNYDIWSDDELFKTFIIDQYNQKKMFLTLNDISSYFNVTTPTMKKRLVKLDLINKYFYIQSSYLERIFYELLDQNNILYQCHNRKILSKNDNNHGYEIDFIVNNIGIEINDIASHNSLNSDWSTYKDPLYHQQKSLLAIEKNIRLIHIWEWELRTESIWSKLSKWLLNEINVNKYYIDLQNCQIIQVNNELEKQFYNLYSIKDYQESDVCLGLIYNNQLYQTMSFKNIDNQWYLINYGIVYNYNIDYQHILKTFISTYNVKSVYTFCNLDKDDYNLYNRLEFKLLNTLEPFIIWCDKDMNISIDKQKNFVPIYNSGYNVYELRKD